MKSIETLISDMIHAIESIESYHAPSFEVFLDDEKTQDAIMYNWDILTKDLPILKNKLQSIA